MKNNASLIVLALVIVATYALGQQIAPRARTVTVVDIPPVTWQGDNARNIAAQLLTITNLNGSAVVPAGALTGRSSTIILNVTVTTNGVEAITASIK